LDAGKGVTGGGADGTGWGAPWDDAVFCSSLRGLAEFRGNQSHGEAAFFPVEDLPPAEGEAVSRVFHDGFVGQEGVLTVGDEPSIFDEGGVLVEGENVEKVDAAGIGGLEIHEGDNRRVEMRGGGMKFEPAEDLAPRGSGFWIRAAIEGPNGGDLLSVGKVEGGVSGIACYRLDGSSAEKSNVWGGRQFFQCDSI
jgi:hypothetical protein